MTGAFWRWIDQARPYCGRGAGFYTSNKAELERLTEQYIANLCEQLGGEV